MQDRVIGIARSHDELLGAIKVRVAELDVSYETIDQVGGLPERYVNKLFAPVPLKGLGRVSMGLLLGALGLKLLVVEDAEAYARVRDRLVKRAIANGGMPTSKRHARIGDSDWGAGVTIARIASAEPHAT